MKDAEIKSLAEEKLKVITAKEADQNRIKLVDEKLLELDTTNGKNR